MLLLVAELYHAFAEPNDLLTTPRWSPEREELVQSASRFTRDDIPEHLLDDLAWSLTTTIGTPETLRYYLPRILGEALLRDGLNCTEWWVIVGKLQSAALRRGT